MDGLPDKSRIIEHNLKVCSSACLDKRSLLYLEKSSVIVLLVMVLVNLLVRESSSAAAARYQCILAWLMAKSCIVTSFDSWDQNFKLWLVSTLFPFFLSSSFPLFFLFPSFPFFFLGEGNLIPSVSKKFINPLPRRMKAP
jgi:hypothetical protein